VAGAALEALLVPDPILGEDLQATREILFANVRMTMGNDLGDCFPKIFQGLCWH
jgi:hypothetical protein